MHYNALLNDTDPIFVQTDSSDYGIGGYLFQGYLEIHPYQGTVPYHIIGAQLNCWAFRAEPDP
jgi:hypothetical protein